jgi:phage terminase large subunit-like protein
VDLGVKRDTSALVWVSPFDDHVVVRSQVFEAQRVSGMETTLPQVEGKLRELARQYHIRRVNFDAWQMRDLAARLASEGMPMNEFPQNNVNMVPASQLTFDAIANGLLVHDGDKMLRAHVLGTAGEATSTGGWRFAKVKTTKAGARDLSKKNDACIALAMALAGWRQEEHAPKPFAMDW